MTLELTLLMQILLSIMGGTATIAGMILSKKVKRGIRLIFSWMFYTFYVFWGMAAARYMLLYDEMPTYGENAYLIPFDILLVVGISAFIVITGKQQTESCINVKIVLCISLAVISAFRLIILVRRYSNINVAIYRFLCPDSIMLQGIVVLFCYLILIRVLDLGRVRIKNPMPVAVSMLCVITWYWYPTSETLIANAGELMFSLGDVWYMLVIFGVAVFVLVMAVLWLVSEKRCCILCVILWAVCMSAYLQGMLLNSHLFLMDGKKSDWSDHLKITNLAIWCVLLVGLTVLCFVARRFVQKIVVYSSFILCIMQVVGVISLIPAHQNEKVRDAEQYDNYLSMDGIFEVASEENVIVFVLDTYDVDFLEQVLDKQPDFLEPLKGFIYYSDNVSQFSRTFPSIPYMLTEETYFYEQPYTDYVDRAFSECIFWDGLGQSGYQYYLFEETVGIIGDSVLKGAENFVSKGEVLEEELSFSGCVKTAVRIGAYRLMPYMLKDCFTYTSGDINDMVVSRRILDIPMYDEEDAFLWEQLRAQGLTVGNDKKAFRFIHTKGAHAPYTMNEKGRRIDEEKNVPERMYEGCMRFVYDYLEQMQSLGVYEQATIIITADHGENFVTKDLPQETNPILFIKPCGVSADVPMQISDVMASQNDLLPTISAAMDIEYDESWGIDLLNSAGKDKTRTRYHYYAVVENGIQTKARKYSIDGNSRNFANWIATDEYYEFGEFY